LGSVITSPLPSWLNVATAPHLSVNFSWGDMLPTVAPQVIWDMIWAIANMEYGGGGVLL
jgi:hypothetical protein